MITSKRPNSTFLRSLYLCQGLYYLLTGLWPIVHLPSFEKVTGPKEDKWLVKTVGGLITIIGANLSLAGLRDSRAAETPLLAVGEAATFITIETLYVAQRRIRPIYLADALAHLLLLGGWLVATRMEKQKTTSQIGQSFTRSQRWNLYR